MAGGAAGGVIDAGVDGAVIDDVADGAADAARAACVRPALLRLGGLGSNFGDNAGNRFEDLRIDALMRREVQHTGGKGPRR